MGHRLVASGRGQKTCGTQCGEKNSIMRVGKVAMVVADETATVVVEGVVAAIVEGIVAVSIKGIVAAITHTAGVGTMLTELPSTLGTTSHV